VDGVRVIGARGSGDDAIVALVHEADPARVVVVVTADRVLRQRIDRPGVRVLGPRSVPRTPA
jgi:rRNA-processing protein FCF1